MKKPQKTKILGTWFTIKHVDLSEEGLLGDCDIMSATIRIHSELEGRTFKKTLKHERCHAFIETSGLGAMLTDEQQEALCVLFEQF